MRVLAGLVVGLCVAVAVVAAGEAFGHWLYPVPSDVDPSDPRALKTLVEALPAQAMVAVLLAWATGSFLGAVVAVAIAKRPWVSLVIGLAVLAAAAATMTLIPHPPWFMIASLPATLFPAWIASKVVRSGAPT